MFRWHQLDPGSWRKQRVSPQQAAQTCAPGIAKRAAAGRHSQVPPAAAPHSRNITSKKQKAGLWTMIKWTQNV